MNYNPPVPPTTLSGILIVATHPQPASDAGKLLRNRLTPSNVRRVAASDLAQAPKKPAQLISRLRHYVPAPQKSVKLISRLHLYVSRTKKLAQLISKLPLR